MATVAASTTARGDAVDAVLTATGIGKSFGGSVALQNVDFSCYAGEIHALLGANGAGKSTFIKILCGVQPADAGIICLRGSEITLHNPRHAAELGISAVFQELSLCPHLTVAENIMLAHEPTGMLGQIRNRSVGERVRALLHDFGIEHIASNVLVADLTLADRQLVEIVKALSHEPQILIVDEGTSALAYEETRQLFGLLHRLRAQGKAVIFISHRMVEIREIADRITVFRNGSNVLTITAGKMDEDELIEHMLGERVQQTFPERHDIDGGVAPRLQVEHLDAGDLLRDISFSAHPGEILGIAGLEGQGQGELLLTLFGMVRHITGQIRVDGHAVRLGSPWRAIRAGFALIPEDRKTQGLLLPKSLRENIVLATLTTVSRLGLVMPRREADITRRGMQRLQIVASSPELPVHAMSGGNQQKVVIAKWLETGAGIFLFYDPTRGVDVGTKSAFYELISELADAGKTVLLYTTELSELVGLCHRVLVMHDRHIETTLTGDDITETRILSASLGRQAAAQNQAAHSSSAQQE